MKRKLSESEGDAKQMKNVDMENETDEDCPNRDGLNALLSSLDASKKVLKRFLKEEINHGVLEDDNIELVETIGNYEELESEDNETDKNHSDDDSDLEECSNRKMKDPYKVHFEQTIDEDIMEGVTKSKFKQEQKVTIGDKEIKETLGLPKEIQKQLEANLFSSITTDSSDDNMGLRHLKEGLLEKWKELNVGRKKKSLFTGVQKHIYEDIFSYKDVFYHNRTHINGEEVRRLYCLHASNHVLKARARVMKNNAKIAANAEENATSQDSDSCRDQGLTRPKVLILAPFRDSCLRIVNNIINMGVTKTKGQVMNKKRFVQEYSTEEDHKATKQPDDFKYTFRGNIDDCFRIGLTLSKNTVKDRKSVV